MEKYFTQTMIGRQRTQWIVPVPLFVESDMAYGVQIADVCIYALNWGWRVGNMTEPTRAEIVPFARMLDPIIWHGDGYRDGQTFKTYGTVFVPDPYVIYRYRRRASWRAWTTNSSQSTVHGRRRPAPRPFPRPCSSTRPTPPSADGLSQIVSVWRERGGQLFFFTATPYRGDRRPVASKAAAYLLWEATDGMRPRFVKETPDDQIATLTA